MVPPYHYEACLNFSMLGEQLHMSKCFLSDSNQTAYRANIFHEPSNQIALHHIGCLAARLAMKARGNERGIE